MHFINFSLISVWQKHISQCFLDFSLQVEFNPNQSSLTVEGDDIDAFDKVMQHISYLNSRQFPTPGIRHLRISTTVK